MTVEPRVDDPNDQFPVGMRVLAVDDDPTCLLILETLLRRCHYHVLSANGDPKLVMKGITHGACDYLLKPVRIEELKNIWQHVIRRKKFDPKDQMNSINQAKLDSENGEVADPSGKFKKKRKDQNYDEDDDQDCNGQEDDDSSTQKKPRVVRSVELHRKFVNAVNQLGIDSRGSAQKDFGLDER